MKKVQYFILTVVATFLVLKMSAQDRPVHELHSMLVFNFLKYIEWPADAKTGDFHIVVIGDDDVYGSLSAFYSARKIGGQSVKITNLGSVSMLDDAHLVYLSNKSSNEFDDLKAKVAGKPTLTITDRNGLGKKGSCINFRVVGGKLKFEVNEQAIADSNLKIANQLVTMGISI